MHGIYLWDADNHLKHLTDAEIARRIVSIGVERVLIKIRNGTAAKNPRKGPEIARILRGEGVIVDTWATPYPVGGGGSPEAHIELQARRICEDAERYDAGRIGLNLESRWSYRQQYARLRPHFGEDPAAHKRGLQRLALLLGEHMRAGAGGRPLSLCTFPFPKAHGLPFAELCTWVDEVSPMVYFAPLAKRTRKSIAQWRALTSLPLRFAGYSRADVAGLREQLAALQQTEAQGVDVTLDWWDFDQMNSAHIASLRTLLTEAPAPMATPASFSLFSRSAARAPAREALVVVEETVDLVAEPTLSADVVAQISFNHRVEPAPVLCDGAWRYVRTTVGEAQVAGWLLTSSVGPYIAAAPSMASPAAAESEPAWLTTARQELGVRERAGHASNPRILEYHRTTRLHANSDEVPWCSSFINWCLLQADIKGTNSARARSWLGWAGGSELKPPRPGCITVVSRGGGRGHVGFFLSETDDEVVLLGGNQSDAVSIQSYPKVRVLGHIWPT